MIDMMEKIVCPQCKSAFDKRDPDLWTCPHCGFQVKVCNGKPVFTDAPGDLNPSEKIERCADQGSVWRRINWKFIEKTASRLSSEAEVLDIGAGRGDFKAIFSGSRYMGLDIYPYPELDLAVDLIQMCPFVEGSFDLVVLANVIEHVYDYRALVSKAAYLLKPGGRVLITVPFLLKLHQEPVDYHRYTKYTLKQLAVENGLIIETLDGYYNPLALMDEGIGDTWQHLIPKAAGVNRFFAKVGIAVAQRVSNSLKKILGNGYTSNADEETNPYVMGYLCLFKKPERIA